MTTSTVNYIGSLRTEATHSKSGQSLITDAPVDNNGKGQAFSPTDLVATALASCVITIMGIKANNMGIELGQMHADVYKTMASTPRRISGVKVELRINGQYTNEEKHALEVAGQNCPVAKSLHNEVVQDLQFVWLQG